MKIVINPQYKHLKLFVENIEEHFHASSDILYDERNQIRVVSFEGEEYVVKSFKIPNLINRFVYRFLRPSKAKRSYEYSMKLGEEYCPEAVAFTEEHHKISLAKSYYISKKYDYDFTIRPVLLDGTFNKKKRHDVLNAFASFTYTLHEDNILHNDYSYGNILIKEIQPADTNSQYEFRIIDVNRMQFKALSLDERLNNFSRLSASDEAMAIIMTRYAACVGEPVDTILARAKFFRDEFMRKRVLKNKLRGR